SVLARIARNWGVGRVETAFAGRGSARTDDLGVHYYLPDVRPRGDGTDADECVPVLLRLHGVWRASQAQAGRLLRLLLLRLGALPAGPRGRLLPVGAPPRPVRVGRARLGTRVADAPPKSRAGSLQLHTRDDGHPTALWR